LLTEKAEKKDNGRLNTANNKIFFVLAGLDLLFKSPGGDP